jgi:hypothetical protein
MAFDPGAVGRAFSEHRFDEALPHLAKDVRWTVVGYMVLEGVDAVRQTCRETMEATTAVASCDIHEFSEDEITAITSYAVEVDRADTGSQPPPRSPA